MSYKKRYEDSYLDEEDEEFAGDERSDGEKIVSLLQKAERTQKENERIKRLTERLFMGARMPATPGALAVADIALVAETYAGLGDADTAVLMWSRLSEIAEANGDRELYYRSLDEMTNLR